MFVEPCNVFFPIDVLWVYVDQYVNMIKNMNRCRKKSSEMAYEKSYFYREKIKNISLSTQII